jgi:phthalate 4,5-cis-dihydrodiol dehydrogenase
VVKLGIIGLGGGASQMIPAFVKHPHIRLVAAADIDAELLDTFCRAFQAETFLSAAELCQCSEVDAVYIATPNQFHTAHAVMALENRKHVLVEKPMTLTLDDAQRMIDTAARHGMQLAVNVKHSFEPRIRQLRDIVRSGELGQLRMLHYWYFNDWLYSPRTAEELNPDLGGGVPWRQGPHQIDILRTIAGGLVRSVRAMTGVWDANRPVAGAYASFLEFEDGTVATAVYSGHDHFNSKALTYQVDAGATWTAPPYAKARKALRQAGGAAAETALKRARRFGGAAQVTHQPSPWILGGPLIVSFDRGEMRLTPNGLLIYGEDDMWEMAISADTDGRDGVVKQFYDAVVHGKRLANDGVWGKATLEVLLALLQSSTERREVLLSHQVATTDDEDV